MPKPCLIIVVDGSTRLDWRIVADEYGAAVILPAGHVDADTADAIASAIEAFGTDGRCGVGQGFTPQSLAEAVAMLKKSGATELELRADHRLWDQARIAISLSREPGIVLTDLGGASAETNAADRRQRAGVGVIAILDGDFNDAPRWDILASEYGATAVIVERPEGEVIATEVADCLVRFRERDVPTNVVGPYLDTANINEAIEWLRSIGMTRIEVWADESRHADVRVILSQLREPARICNAEGEAIDEEAITHRPLTTSTLLMVAADAVFTPITELGPFEQLLLEEVGGWEDDHIAECRALSGWYRRLAMLHSALRPAMTVILAEPGVRPMHRAATRMLNAVPDRGLRARHTLGEPWSSDGVLNDAARVVETAKARGGRGPERIVIVVRESDEWVQDALYRATTALDEARVEIVAVDPALGLLERDVTLFWSEEDAAAHAANLAAILAERESTEPF